MADMTKNPQNQPYVKRLRNRSVLFVGLEGVQLLDIVGPMEALDAVNRLMTSQGRPAPYTLGLASPTARVRTAAGLEVCAAPLRSAKCAHTLVVGGSLEMASQAQPRGVLAQIERLAHGAQRVVSVCTGAFVLGALGLLNGRRCTSHWLTLNDLRRRFPKAHVETDAIYTLDHPIYTSAGVTSGLDLALCLIEQDLGSSVALAVARMLVVFLHRPGGQSQFSASMQLRSGTDQRIRKLVAGVVERPGADHSVDVLAGRAAMSPRNFARVFRQQTGLTPAGFVEQVRLDAARSALERTDETTASIAEDCGFGTDETLRRVFHRALGITPGEYRQRFHQRGGLNRRHAVA